VALRQPSEKCKVSLFHHSIMADCCSGFILYRSNDKSSRQIIDAMLLATHIRVCSGKCGTLSFLLDFILWPSVLQRLLSYEQVPQVYVPSHGRHISCSSNPFDNPVDSVS
jgi:hypothetical protein